MPNPLAIMLDAPQARLSRDMMSTLVSGRDWSPTDLSNVFVDPVTNTAFLAPACADPAWTTTTAGIYAKYGIGDYLSLTDSGNWTTHSADLGGPFIYYIGPSGNTGGLQGLLPVQGINQSMVVEIFTQATTPSTDSILEFGWSDTGDGSAGVSLRLYQDGRMEVWKAGVIVGTYATAGKGPDYFGGQTPLGAQLGGGATRQAPKTGYHQLVLIPCRDRELLAISSQGGGFAHVFEDLAEGIAGHTITDAANFWFYVPTPVIANLRIAQCQYQASGYICGAPSAWKNNPSGLDTPTLANGGLVVYQALSDAAASDTAGPGVVTPNLVASPPNPYTVLYPVQLMAAMQATSTTPNGTPFLYGLRATYPAATAVTTAPSGDGLTEGLDLLPYCLEFSLDVSDTIGGTRARLAVHGPEAIGAAGASDLLTGCNRPFQISDEVGMTVNGVGEGPRYQDSFGFDDAGYDLAQTVSFEVRDGWSLAERYIFGDPVPLDGLSLSAAYSLVAQAVGLATGPAVDGSDGLYISPSAASFVPVQAGSASGNGWNVLIDVGDRGAEWLDRLHQTYAGNWFHGFRPNLTTGEPPVLCLIDPSDVSGAYALPSTPSLTLYPSIAAAVAGGEAADDAWKFVYRSYRTQVLAPEANDLWVVGRDPRTGKPIVGHSADAASQAVTTPPASRPANWLGFIRKYAWMDPNLTTMGTVQAALDLLAARLTVARPIVEVGAEYQPGLWRGDLISIQPQTGDAFNARVKAFGGRFEYVGTFGDAESPDGVWRPSIYVCEAGPLIAPLDVFGTALPSIGLNWSGLKALAKNRIWDDMDVVARRAVLNQQG